MNFTMNENNASSLKNSNSISGEILRNLSAPLSVAVDIYTKQSAEMVERLEQLSVKNEDTPTS